LYQSTIRTGDGNTSKIITHSLYINYHESNPVFIIYKTKKNKRATNTLKSTKHRPKLD
jgi:hypothetical protein